MTSHTTKEIVLMFLQRDFGFTIGEAKKELTVLYINDEPVLRVYYLYVSRTGCKRLSDGRSDRNKIYNAFENAQNHSTFFESDIN